MSINSLFGLSFADGVPADVQEAADLAAERMAESSSALLDVIGTFQKMSEAFADEEGDKSLQPQFLGGWLYGVDYVLPDADGDEKRERGRMNRSSTHAFAIGDFLNLTGAGEMPVATTARLDSEWKRPGVFASCFLKAVKAAKREPSEIRLEAKKFAEIPAGPQSARAIYARLASIDEKSAKPWAVAFARTLLEEKTAKPASPSALWRLLVTFGSDEVLRSKAVEYLRESDDLSGEDLGSVVSLLGDLSEAAKANHERHEVHDLDGEALADRLADDDD